MRLVVSERPRAVHAIRAMGASRRALSARVLEKAVNTHVLIIGLDKKNALKEAVKREPASAPISQFLPNATVHWSPA